MPRPISLIKSVEWYNGLMNISIPRCKTKGQILYYGFKVTEDWLINHTITHRDTYDIPFSEFNLINLYHSRSVLRRQTGIKQLSLEQILPENPPVLPPKGMKLIHPPSYGRTMVAVCSSLKNSFRNRPSQAQVDHLKQILGAEEDPKWYIDDGPDVD